MVEQRFKIETAMKKHNILEQGSLTSIERNEVQRKRIAAAEYQCQPPWTEKMDLISEFDKQIEAVNYSLHSPWEEDLEPRKENCEDYVFERLWGPTALTSQQEKQLESYSYNPPFRCEFNMKIEKPKVNKKMLSKQGRTIPPWAQGALVTLKSCCQ